jgi:NAD(P)-dependent dehydrogenase (short-subunit alcohol dehydrogenase family)
MSRLLVIGARVGSLGEALVYEGRSVGLEVTSAGVGPDEQMEMDVCLHHDIHRVLDTVRPHHVVCTVGLNLPAHHASPLWLPNVADSLYTNVVGVAQAMQAWLLRDVSGLTEEHPGHFVVVSSNSAHIARTNSAPYCASKAALSMLVRCVAREAARGDEGGRHDRLVYAYEPGLLNTMQTKEVRERLGDRPMHRMPGVEGSGLDPEWLARIIVGNLLGNGPGLNGTTIRLDAGEQ